MTVINIREAKREGARLVVGLAGISGSGKTRTALELAYGLANYNSRKVGFIDTENKRGSLYADVLMNEAGEVQPFLIGDLEPPFSPQRYIDAIVAFQKAGVEVLVIDSITHEWEGTGGCEEIATSANPRLPDWATAKREHKRFMNALLQSDMHVIVCVRAREKVSITKENGKTVVNQLGIMPVTEKNVMFEMTASLLMWNGGKMQEAMKVPHELKHILGREKDYITAADGKALRVWVDGAQQLDPAVESARNSLRMVCEQGMTALGSAWTATPKNIKTALGQPFLETLKQSALAYDQIRTESTGAAANVDELNATLLGAGG